MVGLLRDRVCATGNYSALPMNPYRHPQWPPFRVCHNGKWVVVEVVGCGEDWGWEAQERAALERDAETDPRIDIRRPPLQ